MASNFHKILRLNISFCRNFIRKNSNITPLQNVVRPPLTLNTNTFSPPIQNWIYYQNNKIESPTSNVTIDELPLRIDRLNIIDVPAVSNDAVIQDPDRIENTLKKEAVKMIVIRRHKMRKHKLKKLRKKMKFEWAKLRQRREMRKEKEFQAGLIAQIKQAEVFSAENYVNEKIKAATETPIPRFWKGRRLPEFLIRQLMGLPPK